MTSRAIILGSHAASLKNFRGALIETLAERGYAIHAAAPRLTADIETSDWLQQKGVAGHDVLLSRTGLNPFIDILLFAQLYRLSRALRPAVFLGYTAKPIVWGLLAAYFTRVPQRVALVTGLGYAFTGVARGRRRIIQILVRLLYRIALSRATIVLFQNEDDESDFKRLGILSCKVPSKIVNGSGVDIQHFSDTPLPEGPVVFLMIARLLGDKGVREYVEAAKCIRADWPEVQFQLVGGIDCNPDSILESEVIRWHDAGWINWIRELSDVRPAIKSCHVYVLPSYREGMPRTVLEAMSMGRPIITTDAPGCRQAVAHGKNGFLVPVADSFELQDAMLHFLEKPKLIKTMGRQSRKMAEEKYDVRLVNLSILAAMDLE